MGLRRGQPGLAPRALGRLNVALRDQNQADLGSGQGGRGVVLPDEDALTVREAALRHRREEVPELDDAIRVDHELARVAALGVEDEDLLQVGLLAELWRGGHRQASQLTALTKGGRTPPRLFPRP